MQLKLTKLPDGVKSLVVMLQCSKEEAKGLKANNQPLPPKIPFAEPIPLNGVVTVDDALGHRILGAYPGSFQPVLEAVAPVRSAHVLDEAHAVDELHREEAPVVLDEQLVETHQIRVRHIGEASELPLQPIEIGGAGAKQGLQRDDLVADAVVRLVDDAHSARAELS